MSSYSIYANLLKLPGVAVTTTKKGNRCLVIKLGEPNGLDEGKNGGCFLNLEMWENRGGEDKYGQTHGIKPRLSKEQREGLAQGSQIPFIGSARPIKTQGAATSAKVSWADEEDDLPF